MSAHDDLEVFRSSRLRSLLARTREASRRMSTVDHPGHVPTETRELGGTERFTPWDPALAVAMRERGTVVFEESVDSALLEDLAAR
ncbi:DUF2399 domain-containing protein [Nocardiopsis sp. L17-MgMaSL7]|uniref:DUF2399 domain-containing protein n=1 Tax=Nocardiopsis sp. L17-MgMaSL7 TaxID=1938893 RepID=UPI000D9F9C99|nr:DUF2399 domain-containing protein [Nocardiopsis sp. L17-MgMaSL7]PWV47368.1 hypothetical protein BDW27_112166 [Nocardiopsis sp. L17-MgMaSL7]